MILYKNWEGFFCSSLFFNILTWFFFQLFLWVFYKQMSFNEANIVIILGCCLQLPYLLFLISKKIKNHLKSFIFWKKKVMVSPYLYILGFSLVLIFAFMEGDYILFLGQLFLVLYLYLIDRNF